MRDEPTTLEEESADPEIAWAAGLFEGEGCLTISAGCPRMKLNSTDEDVVRRFHDAIGVGQVRVERGGNRRGYKTQWEWYSGNKRDIGIAIELLWRWLGHRRRERALELMPLLAYKD